MINKEEIKLTICVCSLMSRTINFLPNMLRKLDIQTKDRLDVEVLVLIDNKKRSVGTKRNEMVNIAQGKYITFIDDDDDISSFYVNELIEAIDNNNVDVINFISIVSLNGGEFKPMYFSILNKRNYHNDQQYFRSPNHLMCVRTELAKQTPYVTKGYEDFKYMADLLPKLKTEYNINEILYKYIFNDNTTETQKKC